MRRPSQIFTVVSLAVLGACGGGSDGYTAGPGGTTGGGGGGGNNNPSSPVATNAVAVSDNQFSPVAIQITPGTTVTWTWASGASTHNVSFADGTASQLLESNATFSRAFPTAGTFNYQCTLHAGMTGTVTVR